MLETLHAATLRADATGQTLHGRDLVAVVAQLVRELHPQRSRFIEVSPSSRIERDLGIDIPEIDYPKLVTLDGAVKYITAHLK